MQTKRLVAIALALAIFYLMPVTNAEYVTNEEYYGGLGTHNLEVGVHEPTALETNKPYQLYIARLDNTGNVNLTILIKTKITFISDSATIENPNSTKINFIGKKEYTQEIVEYPFLLTPDMQLQVWLNITLNEPGNYTFNFETDSQPELPEDVHSPISVSNGKFTAKLVVESPMPFNWFGFSLNHAIAIGAGTVLLTLIAASMLMRRHAKMKMQMLTGKNKPSRKNYTHQKRRKQREPKQQSP